MSSVEVFTTESGEMKLHAQFEANINKENAAETVIDMIDIPVHPFVVDRVDGATNISFNLVPVDKNFEIFVKCAIRL